MSKPTKPKPINWDAIRAEYEAGGVTLQQLADRLGTSLRTVLRRSKKESWAKGVKQVSQEVSQEVSQRVRGQVIERRVQSALSDLEMIDNMIRRAYLESQALEFKTAEGAIASADKLLKTKLSYSDEHVQKWLLDKGYVAVPIAEFAPSVETSDRENGEAGEAIAHDTVMARVAEIEPTIIPASNRNLEVLLSRETGDRVQDS